MKYHRRVDGGLDRDGSGGDGKKRSELGAYKCRLALVSHFGMHGGEREKGVKVSAKILGPRN